MLLASRAGGEWTSSLKSPSVDTGDSNTHPEFPPLPTSVESDSLGFGFKYLFLKHTTTWSAHPPATSQPSGLRRNLFR